MKNLVIKTLVLFFAVFLFNTTVSAKSKKKSDPAPVKNAPVWATDEGRVKAFPNDEYISALGRGFNQNQAKNRAAAAISNYIKTNVKSESLSTQTVTVKNGSVVDKSRSASEEIDITSDEEIYSLEYTDVWQDPSTSEYCCVAFIDRAACWARLEAKLSVIRQNVAQKHALATERNDALLKVITLAAIQKDRAEFQKLYDFGNIVLPAKCVAYKGTAGVFVTAENECARLKPTVAIVVNVTGDKDGIVARKIAAILEGAGCTVSTGSAAYVAEAKVTVQIEEQRDAFTCRPGIEVDLYKMRGGNTLVSYNKTVAKAAGFDKDGAIRAAYRSIENELEESFINEIIFAK